MNKDFNCINDEKERKIIELLTPKHLHHTMKLKKADQRNKKLIWLIQASAIAATIAILLIMGFNPLRPNTAYASPMSSKEIITHAIKAIREVSTISLEFDTRVNSASPDYVECSSTGQPAKCKYRCIQNEENIIQRVDIDFDSIKVCNIFVNDSVYMWKNKELLYKGIKKSPTGLKGLIKMENVLEKFSDYKDIKIENNEHSTTLRHETSIEGGTLIIEGHFDNATGLLNSCRNLFLYNGIKFPIVESTKMEYNIPIKEEELLIP